MGTGVRISAIREEDYGGCLLHYFEESDYSQRQIGFILPPSVDDLKFLFPMGAAYKLVDASGSRDRIRGVMRAMGRPGKTSPRINVRFVVDDPKLIRVVYPSILSLAKSMRKLVIVSYFVFAYDKEKIEVLHDLGFMDGATTLKTACLNGEYYDTLYLYHDLEKEYKDPPRLKYAEDGDLYPLLPVEKHKQPLKLAFRVPSADDAGDLSESMSQQNTFRTLAMGVYQGFMTKTESASFLEQGKKTGLLFPVACFDTEKSKAIGMSDIQIMNDHVSRHTGHVGIQINPQYHGLGVGTALFKEIDLLAKRLHLESLVLSYFEINEAGKRLYEKSGYEYRGEVPGWLSSKYVKEIFMQKMLR